MTKLKGIVFRSYANQETPTPRKQWVSHTGKRQRVKYLRVLCKDVINSKEEDTLEALKLVREFVAGKFEEYGTLMIIHQAMDISDSTGVTVAEALTYIVEKLRADTEEATKIAAEKIAEAAIGHAAHPQSELEIKVEEEDAPQTVDENS